MTVKKIMLDWVSGNLYLERFDYIFYISCREINQISEQSVSDMISAGCPDRTLPQSVLREKPDKLLIIVDGFDELAFSLGLSEDEICRDPFKKQPVAITLINLLRKNILSTCSIILTTRPVAMSQLREYLITARYAEIIGFTEEDRRIYFNNFFDNNSQASLALTVVKDNDILYTMCCFPIVCWSICTLMKEQLIQGNNVLYTSPSTTTTAVYLSLLSILLRDHSKASLMDMDMHKCLKRLCSLALDGIFKQNTLFTEDDVKHYDLTFPGIRYLFLSQMDFKVGIDHINTYSFIHLSFQNFFAALFFLLDVDVDTNNNSTFPERNVNQFLKTYSESDGTHLMSTVLFMFGLINSDRRSHMEEHLSMKVSERARNDLLVWIKEPKNVLPGLDAFYILYEIHDEDVVNTAMKHAKKEISITEMMRMIDMDYRVLYFYFQKSGYSKLLWKCFLLMCIYFHAKFSSTRAASHELWIKIRPIIKCCC